MCLIINSNMQKLFDLLQDIDQQHTRIYITNELWMNELLHTSLYYGKTETYFIGRQTYF